MVNQTAYNSLRQHAPRLALALLFQPERQKATLSTLLLLGYPILAFTMHYVQMNWQLEDIVKIHRGKTRVNEGTR